MKTDALLKEIGQEEYDRLSEIADRRLAEFGMTADEVKLILSGNTRTPAGVAPEGWNEVKGTVLAATASRERIKMWLERAAERADPEEMPWDRAYNEQ